VKKVKENKPKRKRGRPKKGEEIIAKTNPCRNGKPAMNVGEITG
jgi:hypothetical protein